MLSKQSCLILASSSVYRQAMLKRFGLAFRSVNANIDETPFPNEAPEKLALRLAKAKATAVAQKHPGSIVIGADQVATFNGSPIGKPGSYDKAFTQLQELSGKTVEFHSALAVTDGEQILHDDIVTYCQFKTLSHDEIEHYLHFDQPFDTAGSAKAESLGIALMENMKSNDPTAIIGLPLITLAKFLRQLGLNPILLASKDTSNHE